MQTIFNTLFSAPDFPADLLPHRTPGAILQAVQEAFRLVYYRGVYDGFLAGAIVVLVFLPTRCRYKQ